MVILVLQYSYMYKLKRVKEELKKEYPNCIVIGLGKHEYENDVCKKCLTKKRFNYKYGHSSI